MVLREAVHEISEEQPSSCSQVLVLVHVTGLPRWLTRCNSLKMVKVATQILEEDSANLERVSAYSLLYMASFQASKVRTVTTS